jgi:murein L,D-transpeptidase YcbB/YkuD
LSGSGPIRSSIACNWFWLAKTSALASARAFSFAVGHKIAPLKNLFGEDFRFHSSGGVRIQNVRELVNWLLRDMPGWSRKEIDQGDTQRRSQGRAAGAAGAGLRVYVTAWATPDGVVQFREDIYGRDGIDSPRQALAA